MDVKKQSRVTTLPRNPVKCSWWGGLDLRSFTFIVFVKKRLFPYAVKTCRTHDHMFEIPMDVIIDILLWLPVKPLLRFKCVSRSWHDLISDPGFVKLHLKHSLETNSHTRLVVQNSSLYSIDLECPESRTKLCDPFCGSMGLPSIVGSCNGLLLVAYVCRDDTLFIVNPNTRHYKKIPPLGTGEDGCSLIRTGYGTCGFGYHSASDDYKVFWLEPSRRCKGNASAIYSMNSGSWEWIQWPCGSTPLFFYNTAMPVLLNEVLHWIVLNYFESGPYVSILGVSIAVSILGFSIADHSFTRMHIPHIDSRHLTFLGVLNGCLSLIDFGHLDAAIWMMKTYRSEYSWTKLYSIPTTGLGRSRGPGFTGMTIKKEIAYSRNRRELFLSLGGGNLFSYGLVEKSLKKFEIPEFLMTSTVTNAMLYVESLVQPKDGHRITGAEMLRFEGRKRPYQLRWKRAISGFCSRVRNEMAISVANFTKTFRGKTQSG